MKFFKIQLLTVLGLLTCISNSVFAEIFRNKTGTRVNVLILKGHKKEFVDKFVLRRNEKRVVDLSAYNLSGVDIIAKSVRVGELEDDENLDVEMVSENLNTELSYEIDAMDSDDTPAVRVANYNGFERPCERPCDKSCFTKHDRPCDKPCHDKPYHDKPCHDKPCHDKPYHDKPCHDKPCHDKPCHKPYEKPCFTKHDRPCFTHQESVHDRPCFTKHDRPCHDKCDNFCSKPCEKPCHDKCDNFCSKPCERPSHEKPCHNSCEKPCFTKHDRPCHSRVDQCITKIDCVTKIDCCKTKHDHCVTRHDHCSDKHNDCDKICNATLKVSPRQMYSGNEFLITLDKKHCKFKIRLIRLLQDQENQNSVG